MAEVVCEVCGRKIDSRGLSGHMKTHKADEGDGSDGGVISYPSNEQKIEKTDTVVDLGKPQGKPAAQVPRKPPSKSVKKPVKKTVASKPASSSTSKPDADGQKLVKEVKKVIEKEWQGLFRD